MRVHTAERHGDAPGALAKRLEAAWVGTGMRAGAAGCAHPFRLSEDGVSQYAVCWVDREVWEVLVHGALWISFGEQGLATPEVFAHEDT